MNFLYPGFLFALLTVAIPIVIHLFNFRKFKKIYFSNVAFLQEIKAQNSSSSQLKNLLILFARILALVFLVLAFAQPFLTSNQEIDQNKTNIVSIYTDNSYSMEAVNQEGSLLDEAKRNAKEIAKSFQVNDRFQVLTNDFEAKHQRLLNLEEFLQAVEEVKISATSKNMQEVINRQQSIFVGNSNRFAYLISDFQQGFTGSQLMPSHQNTNLSLIKLNTNALPNLAVDSVWFLSPVHQPKTSEKLVVQLRNYGEKDVKNTPIKLSIGTLQKAISTTNVGAGKTKLDTLTFSGLSAGWQKATVSIKDYPITFDDQLNFTFKVNTFQKVLSINGNVTTNYLKALFSADTYFNLTEMPESNINYSALSNYSLIVLNNLVNPSSGLLQELKVYVKNGGTLVIFPDLTVDFKTHNNFLTGLGLPAITALKTNALNASAIDLNHPIFKEVFEQIPKNLDLPLVNRYYTFTENNTSTKENILQLAGNQLFFAKYKNQSGQIYLSATALNNTDSNLPNHPIFVPLMYKIAFSAAKEQALYAVIGNNNVLEIAKQNLGQNQSLKLVAPNFYAIPEIKQSEGKTLLYVADQVKKTGFYTVKIVDSVLAEIAFNNNKAESDMHYTEEDALQKQFGKQKITFINQNKNILTSALPLKNKGAEIWKLCLILSLVFLSIEMILIRFFKVKKHVN